MSIHEYSSSTFSLKDQVIKIFFEIIFIFIKCYKIVFIILGKLWKHIGNYIFKNY